MSTKKMSIEEFKASMKSTRKGQKGTGWKKSVREYLLSKPVCTVEELITKTRDDLEVNKASKKNLASILHYLRTDEDAPMDVSSDKGVITLLSYWDAEKNQPVEVKH